MIKQLKGVAVGAGYFSQFHYDAWKRIPEVTITAICDIEAERSIPMVKKHGIAKHYTDYREMILSEKPDFVDIITPPETHYEICAFAADQGVAIICQKPLAPSYEEAKKLVKYVTDKGVRFVVHENFRYQPWHREIKKLIDQGVIGELFHLNFRSRMGDGWGENAYLGRQPYFRDYKKLLIYETGVHYIDVFRYHAGEVKSAYAILKRLNPVIQGEDAAMMFLKFDNNASSLWDANRYNESNFKKFRYTFGEYLIDGSKGSIRLYPDGKLSIQLLGQAEKEHIYLHKDVGFTGDSCYIFQRDIVDKFLSGKAFETGGEDYLRNLQVQEAVYESARLEVPVNL